MSPERANVIGALWMVAAMAGFAVEDALLKVASASLPKAQVLVMFGLGGVYVEVLQDVAFRVPPLTDQDARNLVREVRGYPLLEGYRGAAPGDVASLEDVLLRVSRLACNHPEIAEMDLNPIKVLQPGQGCVAVDARIALEPVAVTDDSVGQVVETIQNSANTGRIGDGKIFVLDVGHAVRIRTGETNAEAL